jgi:hypothetical protein
MHKIHSALKGFIIYNFFTEVLDDDLLFNFGIDVDAMTVNGDGSGNGIYDTSGLIVKHLYGDGIGYGSDGKGNSYERVGLVLSTEEADA